jgi:hypothetical protein
MENVNIEEKSKQDALRILEDARARICADWEANCFTADLAWKVLYDACDHINGIHVLTPILKWWND